MEFITDKSAEHLFQTVMIGNRFSYNGLERLGYIQQIGKIYGNKGDKRASFSFHLYHNNEHLSEKKEYHRFKSKISEKNLQSNFINFALEQLEKLRFKTENDSRFEVNNFTLKHNIEIIEKEKIYSLSKIDNLISALELEAAAHKFKKC